MVKEIFEKELAKKGYVRGRFINLSWQTNGANGTLKVSKGVVRVFTIKDNGLVLMKVVNNGKKMVNTSYYDNGVLVNEEEYYSVNKKSMVKEWFSKHVEDIVAIG